VRASITFVRAIAARTASPIQILKNEFHFVKMEKDARCKVRKVVEASVYSGLWHKKARRETTGCYARRKFAGITSRNGRRHFAPRERAARIVHDRVKYPVQVFRFSKARNSRKKIAAEAER